MNQDEIKAKSAALAELYTAKANGKTLQILEDGKWTDWSPGIWSGSTLSYGPNFASDLSCWRVKPEPRRMWQIEHTASRTNSQDTANQWRAQGYTVIEWVEVLP
jgi:hypothetical protein